MNESFGARLRQHREQRGVSLKTIAEQTKIKLALLEGLERDDVSQWPAGIFRRAYVRAYAVAVGGEPDLVVREFFEVHPDPVEKIETPPPQAPGLRGLVGSALGSLARRRRVAIEPQIDQPAATEKPARMIAPQPEPVATRGIVAAEVIEPAPPTRPPAESDIAESPAAPASRAEERSEAEIDPVIDLLATARVCTELGRAENGDQVRPLLAEAARILDARGLIVWVWDSSASQLKAALVHGYSERVRAQLPGVPRDADNATAVAFRTAEPCATSGNDQTSSALVLPLLTPASCAGVLAIELPHGKETATSVRAVATIFAAMLAQLVPAEAQAL